MSISSFILSLCCCQVSLSFYSSCSLIRYPSYFLSSTTIFTHKGGLTKILLQLCLAADDQQASGLPGIVAKEIVAGFGKADSMVAGSAGSRKQTCSKKRYQ